MKKPSTAPAIPSEPESILKPDKTLVASAAAYASLITAYPSAASLA